jgi:steroid delta-isomerase-like uncharacterized protein
MTENYPTLLHRWFEEVWNQGREDTIDELFAEDGIANGLTDEQGNPLVGPEGFKALHRNFLSAFPDFHMTVEDSVIEGDKIAARIRLMATHTGDGIGVAPTNRPVEFSGMCIVHIKDGKIAEAWNEIDFQSLYTQVGALSLDLTNAPLRQESLSDGYETFLHRWFEEAWNKGNEEIIDEMIDDDVIGYGLTDESGNQIRGKEEFRRFYRNFRSAFPDIKFEIQETIVEGDKIGAVCRVTGTHSGDGINLTATNQPIDFSGVLMVRLKDGKMVEAWNYFDFMKLFGQLGALSLNLQ